MVTELESAKLLVDRLEKRIEDLEVGIARTTALLDLVEQKLKALDNKVESQRNYRPSTDIWYK